MNTHNEETTVQDEQQFKFKKEIINDIIKILANNNLTIADAKDILYATSKKICKQKVLISSVSTGWINASDYMENKNIK